MYRPTGMVILVLMLWTAESASAQDGKPERGSAFALENAAPAAERLTVLPGFKA